MVFQSFALFPWLSVLENVQLGLEALDIPPSEIRTRALAAIDADPDVRAVVLLGDGRSFCAGADLNWMKKMAGYGAAENLADAQALAAQSQSIEQELASETATSSCAPGQNAASAAPMSTYASAHIASRRAPAV